jgi:lipopolysaccharide export system permease protein
MSLLHRHLFFSVLIACAGAVGLFGFVLVLGNALKDLLPLVLSGQLEAETALTLLALLGPLRGGVCVADGHPDRGAAGIGPDVGAA